MIARDPGRSEVEEVMRRAEFQYPKSFMERIGDWVAERLERLFDDLPGVDVPAGTFSGGAGSLIGWLMIALAVAAVAVVVVVAIRRWVPTAPDDEEPLSEVEAQHRRTARQWAGDAERHEAAGEWKLAMRARYRELVRTLVDRRQVADVAGATTRELLGDVEVTTFAAARDFESACLLFELPWYADVPTGPQENRRIRELSASVLAAEVDQPIDSLLQVEPGRVELSSGQSR